MSIFRVVQGCKITWLCSCPVIGRRPVCQIGSACTHSGRHSTRTGCSLLRLQDHTKVVDNLLGLLLCSCSSTSLCTQQMQPWLLDKHGVVFATKVYSGFMPDTLQCRTIGQCN